MDIRLLGPVEVVDGNGPLPLGGPKPRTLLVHLLLEPNQLVPADRLIDAVWEEQPPEAARNSLQTYVSHLRKALGAERFEGRGGGYVFHADRSEVDVYRFEELLAQARSKAVTDPAAAVRTYEDALALWRGPALDDLADQPSLGAEIARLEELRLAATEERIAKALEIGRHAEVVPELERLLARHSLRESLWALLMMALYRSGRQGDALGAFQRARDLLVEELGIDPSPELQRLHEQILRQDAALEVSGTPLRGYRLLEPVGEGVFGVVHRALHPQLGREVAVKAIRPRLANNPEFIRRFEAEAQLVIRLEHPHIVPLYDYWREPDGAYLVMRFLRGGSLAEQLADGPLALDVVVRVTDQIALALAAAHAHGIVHRDVKPANILFDEVGNAYLSDFGVAKDLADTQEPGPGETPTGFVHYISPEELRGEAPTTRTDIYTLGLLVYEMLAGQHPYSETPPADMLRKHLRDPVPSLRAVRPDLPASLDEVLARATAKAPQDRYPEAPDLAAAVGAALGPSATRAVSTSAVEVRNPYKGLRPFAEADAGDFFGREHLIERLVERIADTDSRLLAVVGPSGSGKSSLVRAGVVPALRHGMVPGSRRWFFAEMVPGHQPFAELAAALVRVAATAPPTDLASELEATDYGFVKAVDRLLPPDGRELVLVIDQFEELFTLVDDEDMRRTFLDNLTVAATDPRSRVRILLTLRADFYDRPLDYKAFGDLLARQTEAITPLSTVELEQAITGPAGRVGVTVEPALLAEIVAEVAGQPGALPLFQYALTELFEGRSDGLLTLDAYQAIGRVTGALARRAEAIYGRLGQQGQEATRQLFLRLVTLGEVATRRRVLRSELGALEVHREAMDQAIDNFGAHRLLAFDRDPASRGPTVEVAHEALLGRWDRLRDWIDSARQDIHMERSLDAAAAEWQSADRDESYLLRGGRLTQFEEWASTSAVVLGALERQYLNASLAQREAEAAEEDARRAREAALERRSVTRLRALVAVLTVAAVVAGGLTVIVSGQARRLAQQVSVATARGLAAAADANLDVDPERSILLALEAVRTYQDAGLPIGRDAVEALHQAVQASRVVLTLDGLAGGGAQFSPDGTLLATAGTTLAVGDRGTEAILRDAHTGETLRTLVGHEARVIDLEFSADGSRLVTASEDDTTIVWDVATGEQLAQVGGGLSASFSPDGAQVATSGFEGILKIWNVDSGDLLLEIPAQSPLGGNQFSPDGAMVAAAEMDFVAGAGVVWDASTGEEIFRLEGHSGLVFSVSFSPDGRRLATAGMDGTAQVWDLDTGDELHTLRGHAGMLFYVEFSRDGSQLATGSTDATARVWDAETGDQLLVLSGHRSTIGSASFSPDATRLATGSDDGTARVWDLTPQRSGEAVAISTPGRFRQARVTYSPDGTRLLMSSRLLGDGAVGVWDASSGAELATLSAGEDTLFGDATYSPDGAWIAAASMAQGEPGITLWPSPSHDAARARFLATSFPWIWAVDFSPDSRLVAATTEDGLATVWDVGTGAVVHTLEHPDIEPVAFSPDGSVLATAGWDGIARIWDLSSGREVATFTPGEGFPIPGVSFSPAGTQLVTPLGDGTTRILDVASGDELVRLAGHAGIVWDARFSPDGSRVATAGEDGTARLWDAETGQEVLRLPGAGAPVFGVWFNPDGTRLAASSGDGFVRAYLLEVEELLDLARARVSRALTEEECRQYLQQAACPPPF